MGHGNGGQILLTPTLALSGPLFNMCNFKSSFPRWSSFSSTMSSSSRITRERRTDCFLGRDDWNKDLERYDIKNFINRKIELLRIWCHNKSGGLKYGMVNALGQAINVRKASPTNWISEVGTGTWACDLELHQSSHVRIGGNRVTLWIVPSPWSCHLMVTTWGDFNQQIANTELYSQYDLHQSMSLSCSDAVLLELEWLIPYFSGAWTEAFLQVFFVFVFVFEVVPWTVAP